MGRDKKNKPKKPKKYLNVNPSKSFDRVVFFKTNRIEIPHGHGREHGAKAEQEVMSILDRANIPNDLVLKPLLVNVPGGQNEISDGIILYGDTAFLMQIKSRNIDPNEEIVDMKSEIKKVKELVAAAYRQVKKSLDYLKRTGTVTFQNQNNAPVSVRYEDYNWVGLVLINHAKFDEINSLQSLALDNDSQIRDIPRVILSFQDLENISNSFNRTPYYVLNYLRSLQYQSSHTLGDDFRRYSTYLVAGIHDYTRHNFFIEYEKVILEFYETKRLTKVMTKELLYGLDHLAMEAKENLQTYFRSKFDNSKLIDEKSFLKDSFVMPDNRTCYGTLFYNSAKIPPSLILGDELAFACGEFLERHDENIDQVIVIAVDICETNPNKTVGTFIKIR